MEMVQQMAVILCWTGIAFPSHLHSFTVNAEEAVAAVAGQVGFIHSLMKAFKLCIRDFEQRLGGVLNPIAILFISFISGEINKFELSVTYIIFLWKFFLYDYHIAMFWTTRDELLPIIFEWSHVIIMWYVVN